MKRYGWPIIAAATVSLLGSAFPALAVENNLNFSGSLVSEPCDLDPTTTDIAVDFGTIVQEYLYLNTQTASVPFTIHH